MKEIQVTLNLKPEHIQALRTIFDNEKDFVPRDPRDLLLIGIMKQIIDKTSKIDINISIESEKNK